MASGVIKRGLSVQFLADGSVALDREIRKIDDGLKGVEKSGTKSLDAVSGASTKTAASVTGLSQKMAGLLEPVDKAFAGTDRLFSILGKAGAVGALAAAGFALVKAGIEAIKTESKLAEEAQKDLAKQVEATAALGRTLRGGLSSAALSELTPEQVVEHQQRRAQLAIAEKNYTEEIAKQAVLRAEIEAQGAEARDENAAANAFHLERLRDIQRERMEDVLLGEAEIREAERRANAAGLGDAEDKQEAKTKALASAVAKHAEGVDLLRRYYLGARGAIVDFYDEFGARQDRLVEQFGREQEARAAAARATRTMEENTRRLYRTEEETAALVRRQIADRIKLSAVNREGFDAGISGLEEMAVASEAFGAGATLIEGAQMFARMLKAGADAADYAAESIAAFAVGNVFTGAGLAAAALAKTASAAAYGYGLTQIGDSRGGGSGASTPSASPSSAGAAAAAGPPSTDRGSSATTINVAVQGMVYGSADQLENAVFRGYNRAATRDDGPRRSSMRF